MMGALNRTQTDRSQGVATRDELAGSLAGSQTAALDQRTLEPSTAGRPDAFSSQAAFAQNGLVAFANPLTRRQFDELRQFAFHHAGISIADYKQNMVFGRVIKRLRALGIPSVAEYLEFLGSPEGDGEIEKLINALTTNKTSFFREGHHFDHLREKLIPEKMAAVRAGAPRRLRIWSAGCSTGEEPYSIAMTVLAALTTGQGLNHAVDFKVLATDIDTDVVERARAGEYPIEALRNIPSNLARICIHRYRPDDTGIRIREFVKDVVYFKYLNLMSGWPMKGPFDVIFCRNVVIYFNKDTQQVLFNKFADLLPLGGYLYIGHSESLHRITDRFEIVGQSIYRRVS